MSDLVPAAPSPAAPTAARVAIADDAPTIEELFSFAREAELRVQTLRMTIEERVITAKGAETIVHEIQLKHPGHARVATRRSSEPLSRDFDIWLSDGETITTYQAGNNLASTRKHQARVAGSDDLDLPRFARGYQPLTSLPTMGTLQIVNSDKVQPLDTAFMDAVGWYFNWGADTQAVLGPHKPAGT